MENSGHAFSLATPRALAFCAALCLSACAQQADLGRYRPNAWTQFTSFATGGDAESHQLTQTSAELDLRSQSEALRADPTATDRDLVTKIADSLSSDIAVAPSLVYYTKLKAAHPTSLVALVNTIGDDVQADTARLVQFSNVCDEVNRADAMRAEGLIAAPTAPTTIAGEDPLSFVNVRTRLNDNGRVIDATFKAMASRIVSYRTALAHARLDTDETDALALVASAITQMDEQLTRLDRASQQHQAIELSLISKTKV